MGNYVFDTNVLGRTRCARIAADDSSRHDMGGNIVPMLVRDGSAQAYDFLSNMIPGAPEDDIPLLARRRHPGLLLRRAHGPVRGPALFNSTTTAGRS